MPKIETERLCLRSFEKRDLDSFAHLMGDPAVMHFSWHGPYTKRCSELFILRSLAQELKHGLGLLVVDGKEGEFYGYCGLYWDQIEGELVPQLSFRFEEKYWGNGIGEESARAVLNYSFHILNIERIISLIDKEHISSIHLAEKLGAKRIKEITYHDISLDLYQY